MGTSLSPWLKEKGRAFYQHFLEKIPELLRGRGLHSSTF
jgi:hypothetical protein